MGRFFPAALLVLSAPFWIWPALGEDSLRPTMKEFMGLNGHTVLFKPQLYAPVGNRVRDYHPIAWDLDKDTTVLPSFPEAKNRVNWESVYGSWKKEGYNVDACLMFESIKRESWKDPVKDALAYGKFFASEFGPSGSRKVVDSVEIGNEPGEWNDQDYREIFSAMTEGVRAGDAKLSIATCAVVAGPSQKYAKSVDCLKGLEKSYDILTMHTYAQMEGWPTWKRSYPEDPKLPDYLQNVEKLCAWRDQHVPGKPVWITEFGYDSSTKTPSKDDEFKKWQGVSDEQQAQWIVRSYLVFSSMPVERAYLYFFNDDDEPKLHGSAGLTRKFEPKPSYYAVAHLYRTLGDYRFKRTVGNEDGIRIQEYQGATDSLKAIWVVWSPTGGGIEKKIILTNLPGKILRAEHMPLGDKPVSEDPSLFQEKGNGRGEVQAGESPVYLFF